jgi:hypothetical protein
LLWTGNYKPECFRGLRDLFCGALFQTNVIGMYKEFENIRNEIRVSASFLEHHSSRVMMIMIMMMVMMMMI